mgnify:CR=1 FL=1
MDERDLARNIFVEMYDRLENEYYAFKCAEIAIVWALEQADWEKVRKELYYIIQKKDYIINKNTKPEFE